MRGETYLLSSEALVDEQGEVGDGDFSVVVEVCLGVDRLVENHLDEAVDVVGIGVAVVVNVTHLVEGGELHEAEVGDGEPGMNLVG